MRLRLVVSRHNLPETRVLWNIDTSSSPTIYQLLEQVNEIIPIESGEWGLEDYAVQSNGFDCIHYKGVSELCKEDEEVLIKPLSSRDLKVRSISGRHQITSDGRHLVDGVAFGRRQALRPRPLDRPEIHIPPRKRARIMSPEDDIDDEGFAALKSTEERDTDDSNKQLVLSADFHDDDSEDDEDFAPAGDEDQEDLSAEENESADEDLEEESIGGEGDDTQSNPEQTEAAESLNDEGALADFDEAARTKIRKLHSAFPGASLSICRHVYDQAKGNSMILSYEALNRGFKAVKPESEFTETSQEASTTNSKSKKRSADELEDEDEKESDEESQDPFLNYYDQNGLPPGSIASGKALSVMAEAVKGSPNRRPQSSGSVATNKIKFADEELSKGLTSTPLLDADSHEDESEVDNDDASEDTSSSGSSDASGEESDKMDIEDEGTSSGRDTSSDSSSEDGSTEEVVSKTYDNAAARSDNVEDGDTSSSQSDSDSDSSSESSNEDESTGEVPSKTYDKAAAGSDNSEDGDSSSGSDSDSDSDSSSESSSEDETPEEVSSKFVVALSTPTKSPQRRFAGVPDSGKSATKARNERRRKNNALQRYVRAGILPAGTTLKEFNQIELKDDTSAEDALSALQKVRSAMVADESGRSASQALAKTDEFEQRRQRLLASLSSGGVEVGRSSRSPSVSPAPASQGPDAENLTSEASKEPVFDPDEAIIFSTAQEAIVKNYSNQNSQKDASMNTDDIRPSTAPESTDTPSELPLVQPASVESSQVKPSRRPKIDLSAGNRLLFGALGRRAPKNKQDAEKIQKDLMKDARPIKVSKPIEEPVADESESDDDESWREKINYRAVECCYDGVELSEPPFPFKQRWDPQQSGKGLKRMREQTQYHEDAHVSKKQRKRKGKLARAVEWEHDATYESSFQADSVNAQYDDSQMSGVRNDDEGDVNQQLLNDLQAPSAEVSQVPDDLVALPEDPSSLPQLETGKAKVGMTIAFKKLEMSAQTNWQPQMSPYRTAIVVTIEDNGDLDLRLAVRDRALKSYDEETGERMFDKFEMPMDDDEGEDDGRLYLSFGELVEPKIVAHPPTNTVQDSIIDEASQARDGPTTDESVTLSHEREEEPEAQFSHVTETPLQSDAPEQIEEMIIEEVEHAEPVAEDIAPDPKTPSNMGDISSSNAQTIKTIMKDAGFRSSVPTVVLDDLRPNGTETPGDAAVFEKLLNDMTDIGSRSYSPKFNGFGSSPSRQPQERSKSPEESQNLPALSSSPPKQHEAPEAREPSQRATSNSPEPPTSSWQTTDSPFTSLAKIQDNNSSWVTVPNGASSQPEAEAGPEPEEKDPTPRQTPKKASTPRKVPEKNAPTPRKSLRKASSPLLEPQKDTTPIPEIAKPKSIKKAKRRTFGKAQELWENFEPAKKASPAIESQESPDPFGIDENDTTVQYPKLSMGSSFTSQVTDHGRQPDFEFDDSTTTNIETPKVPGLDDDQGAATDVEPELSSHKSIEDNQSNDSVAVEAELPARKPAVEKDTTEDDSDDLPSLDEAFFSQSQKAANKRTPLRSKQTKADKSTAVTIEEDPDDEVTPKASQKHRQTLQSRRPSQGASQIVSQGRSQIQPTKFQSRQPSASQPSGASQRRDSQPRVSASQPFVPIGSQIMDLTMTSSDDEPDSPVKTSKRPRKYNVNSDDDEDFESGWVPKKEKERVGTRRHTSVGLRDSSQTSLNKNRRKTSAR